MSEKSTEQQLREALAGMICGLCLGRIGKPDTFDCPVCSAARAALALPVTPVRREYRLSSDGNGLYPVLSQPCGEALALRLLKSSKKLSPGVRIEVRDAPSPWRPMEEKD